MSQPPPLPCPEARFSCRMSLLEKERVWSIGPDGQLACEEEGSVSRIPLQRIVEIRLTYEPMEYQSERYRCRLRSADAGTLVFQSTHFAGLANFEDRGPAYRSFVKSLIARTARVNPGCVFIGGCSMLKWRIYLVVLSAIFLGLTVVLVVLWAYIGWLVLVKLLLIAIATPALLRWFKRNRPAAFAPDRIPDHLLPRGSDGDPRVS